MIAGEGIAATVAALFAIANVSAPDSWAIRF
jgi:hypothetical protein